MNKIANFFIASEANGYRPPMLTYWAFIIYGLILVVFRLYLGTLPADSSAVDSEPLMRLVNQERSNRNIPQLITHQSLMITAAENIPKQQAPEFFNPAGPGGNYILGKA